jgi:hypothetical protein
LNFILIDFEESCIRVLLASLLLCFAHTPAGLLHQAGIRFAKVYFKWGCAAIEGLKPIALFY